MAISTYNELKTAVENWFKRTDVTPRIDDFIDLTEADLWNGPDLDGAEPLRIRDMEARYTASPSDRYLVLPDQFLEFRKLRFYSGSQPYELTYSTPESLNVLSGSGQPTSYTITSQLEFNRTPSSSYTMEAQYYKSLTALSSSNTSNAVLTRFPSIYLNGCLYHASQWAKKDQDALTYGLRFVGAIKRANKTDRKGRYGAAKAMRREAPTP